MYSLHILPTAIMLVALIIWNVDGVLYLYRLARYFQLEGYNSNRFRQWLFKQPREQVYSLLALLITIAAIFIVFFPHAAIYDIFSTDPEVIEQALAEIEREQAVSQFWSAVIVLFLSVVSFWRRPRDREIKQPFTKTQRAVRLLITASFIPIGLFIFYLGSVIVGIFVKDLQGFIVFSAVGAIIGGGLLHLGWLILPLSNMINFPIEEAFRQYYLARARSYLKRSGATVIAITGSYGKTTTKHYLHHILDGRFRVLMTPKSYNTLLGISRVINDVLAKDVSYDYFIAETDAYFVGENARICRLVNPTIGMIMTVGPMHLERLGSMENIEKAQYEVVQALPPGGAAFFNGDDPAVRKMADRDYPTTRQVVTQQAVPGAQIEAINVRMTTEGLDFDVRNNQTGETRSMHTPLYGEHNVTNILMAVAVAHYLGMSLTEIAMRVATLQPAEHRLIRRVMPDGTIIIDDSYSANPVGTKTALDVLSLHTQSQRRVVISAGMFELGAVSDQENHKLGERMAKVATDAILIGAKQTEPVKAGLESAGFPHEKIHTVSTFNEAVDIYKGILRPGDTLLMLTDLPDTYA